MKRLVIVLLLLPLLSFGQQADNDTAAMVVDNYLKVLNTEGYSEDSMLVMETAVTVYGTTDTIWMRRWFAPTHKHRIELWYNGRLTEALVRNDETRCRHYNGEKDRWENLTEKDFHTRLSGFDFRGPLYLWRWKNMKLTWQGTTELKGETMQVVKAEGAGIFTRYYMFDPESGLLTLVRETEEYDPTQKPIKKDSHIDWRGYHEYLPVSNHLVPSLESFMRDGRLTILSTTAHLEPLIPRIFNRDQL